MCWRLWIWTILNRPTTPMALIHLAGKLRESIRDGDIAARVGGDEFLIFLECKMEIEPAIQRIYSALIGQYKDFTISVSRGVATPQMVGTNYDALFQAADQALYTVKRAGRGHFHFYDGSTGKTLSAISPIDGEQEAGRASDEQKGE